MHHLRFAPFVIAALLGGCDDIAGTGQVRHYTAVATGGNHSCAIAESGEAFCWGTNRLGQLGNGGGHDQFTPSRVAGNVQFASITAGDMHTCALDVNEIAYCWGWGWLYQLGTGEQFGVYAPTPIGDTLRFTQISAGAYHTCALSTDRRVYCWGYNNWGQVGNGSVDSVAVPTAIGDFRAVAVSAGGWHTCALAESGQAYCWGRNDLGQLGINATEPNQVTTPTLVSTSLRFTAIDAGDTHTCGIARDRLAYCWGSAMYGELGDRQITFEGLPGSTTPVPAFLVPAVRSISAGKNVTCAIGTDGQGYCWGRNDYGQLGDGRTAHASVRHTVNVSPGHLYQGDLFKFTEIATGGTTHVCGLVEGSVFCWGTGNSGALGNILNTYTTMPQRIDE